MTTSLTRRLSAQAAVLTFAVGAGLAATVAVAAPASADGPLACSVSNRRAGDTIRVRAQPSTNAAIVANLTTGDSAPSECHFHRYALAGSTYTCFGNPADNTWVRVFEDGRYGYVGWRCVTGP